VTNDPNFERDVLTEFAFLARDARPRVVYSDYDAATFGNAQMGIEYAQLRLRVTRDRSQVFVDLSPRTVAADWFDEDVVIELVAGRARAGQLEANTARPLAAAANAIQEHLSTIVDRFREENWSSTRAALKALQNERAKRLFG
jgi:hypothetical protein